MCMIAETGLLSAANHVQCSSEENAAERLCPV